MKVAITTRATYFQNKARLLPLIDAVSLRGAYGVSELLTRGIEHFESSKDNLLHLGEFTCDDFPADAKHPMIAFAEQKKIPYISFHTGIAVRKYEYDRSKGIHQFTGDILNKNQILALAAERIPNLQKMFSGIIAAENLPNHLSPVNQYVCEPSFISTIIKRYKLRLLFDTGHAQVSAHNMGIPLKRYIDGLPLDRTIEVHIHRPEIVNGKWRDQHGPPGKEEYDLLAYVKERSDISYVTYEYVENEPLSLIASVIKRLRES